MFTSTSCQASHIYFKNAVGHLLAHPLGHYIAVEYYAGPRQPTDIQAFFSHAGQLLARWGWDKLISEHGKMPALTLAEEAWLTQFWHSAAQSQATFLYGALLLPHDLFVRLSWRAKGSVAVSPFKN